MWVGAEVHSRWLHLDYVAVGKANADEGEAVLGLGRLAHRLGHEHVLLCIYIGPKTAHAHGNSGRTQTDTRHQDHTAIMLQLTQS